MDDWTNIWNALASRLPMDASTAPTEVEWSRLVATIDTIGRYLIGLPEPAAERNAKALMEGLGVLDQVYDLRNEMEAMLAASKAAPDGVAERLKLVDEMLGSHIGTFNQFVRRTESNFGSMDQITTDLRHDVEILKGHRRPEPERPDGPVVAPTAPGLAERIHYTAPPALESTESETAEVETAAAPDRVERILQALRDHQGHQRRAAAATNIPAGTISSTIWTLRQKGQLPADIEALIAERQSERLDPKGRKGAAERVADAQRDERERVHDVAEAIHAREPRQNERTDETFEERRARIARDRANANMAARNGAAVGATSDH